ncbi:membrane protein insertase YidC [Albibacterium bauzanense]|uniref:Membrane protein insertase YidC n=1 Tax=Albibacterium bauzanense TaxID=653929 RepID=A0A4R1LZW6_9SPHI|nr:membrane protein insertase YidC [Albibacterium bauzanense]TCK85148.1 YidC/Oxa1 family membrane protein insertase [Albibacterium bauzanense]
MDRNTFTGLFLMLIIIVGSVFLMRPSDEEIKREQLLQDSIALAKTQGVNSTTNNTVTSTAADSTLAIPTQDSIVATGPFGSSKNGSEKLITLENELLKVNITNKGGRIKSVELKNEVDYTGKPLIMFDGDENTFGLQFSSAGENIITNNLYFAGPDQGFEVSNSDSSSVTLRLNYAEGKYIDYIYSLKGNSYQVGFVVVTKGMQDVVAPGEKQLILNWNSALSQKEKDIANEQRYSTAYFRTAEGDVESLSTGKDDQEDIGKTDWITFKQHFFSNTLIADQDFASGTLAVNTTAEANVVKTFEANLNLDFARQDINTYPMKFFFGPNKYSILKDQGYDFEQQIDLGWGPMTWINRFITLPVFNVLEDFNLGYGIIILILTVLLKLVLSPLSYKSYVSMAKMRVLKPEMDEIKKKVGEDNPTLLQQEYLKLYKQAGVNPMGGCIPMILQMPFTIAFFFFFPNLFELRGESFLWMNDLSTYDAIITFKPIFGVGHISLMVILMTLATLLSTWYNNSVSGVTGQMKYIGYFMPLIFLFVLNSYPSGLTYYYFLSTLFTFGQQFAIRQMINDEKIHAKLQENKKKPESKKKKSGFQKRMEDYMRQQTPPTPAPKKK